eukprot:GFYU01015023.1.p1 GENE.GFYU01015023.1~~GFYU01015023.1.p1  ORF type:complete len:152 (+),score=76.59 GFYU01015023.1:42-458(+)
MKKLIKSEKSKGKKQKKRRGRGADDEDMDFQQQSGFDINVKDDRFAALYDSHHFAIDKTDSRFKDTASMNKILSERQQRRVEKEQKGELLDPPKETTGGGSGSSNGGIKDAALNALVNSMKRKGLPASSDKSKKMKAK